MRPGGVRAAVPVTVALLALAAGGCGGGDPEEAPPPEGRDALSVTPDTAGGELDTLAIPDTLVAPDEPAGGTGQTAGETSPTEVADAPLTTTGTVALTGTAEAPMLTLRTSDQTWLLQGDAVPELRRLDGATVRVSGRAGGEPGRLRPLEVASYEIESVGGERPFVGHVDRSDAGEPVLVTDDGTLRLGGAGDLADQVGARVWVVGRRSGEVLSVGSYGIIRPAG
ncbi:MAG: hypothetical protein KY453_06350 [Gemmatimonadetes bacterium]|nr:hypothetical protein [Gemmatimonadota bacterium]